MKVRKGKRNFGGLKTHKSSVLAISMVLMLLVGIVSYQEMTLHAKEKEYKAQEVELQQQIDAEKDRSERIEELASYVGTDEYIEEVAKEKLGLVNENEIIFKAK